MSRADRERKAARARSLLRRLAGEEVTEEAGAVPFEKTPIPAAHYPKKYTPGELAVGDSVWYRGERFWIEWLPEDWTVGVSARISDHQVHPNRPLTQKRASFHVPIDTLDKAPTKARFEQKQPTLAAIERQERLKSGQRDIGDTTAEALRGKDLDETYTFVARRLKVPEDELREAYEKLNPGQQRMCLGNKLRHAIKKGLVKL